MNKRSICNGASVVLSLLNNYFSMTFDDLRLKSRLKDKDLGAAIGWLLHESKIEIVKDETNELEVYQIPFFNQFF